jgi:NAD(P)-dependent dehydrogenase (short-subunit alcohol dehydrogenase family)
MLKNKVVVIYGAGGGIGSAVARRALGPLAAPPVMRQLSGRGLAGGWS